MAGRVHRASGVAVLNLYLELEYLINCQIGEGKKATSGNTVTRSDGVVVILAQFQIGKPVLIVETWRSFIFILTYFHYEQNFQNL